MGTYLVMINNFKRSFRHKEFFIIIFILPVILCILAGMVKFGKVSIRVGLLGTEMSSTKLVDMDEMIDLLEQSKGIRYSFADEESLNTDLMTGKFNMILDFRNREVIGQFNLLSYQSEDNKIMLKTAFVEAITNKEPIQLGGLKKEGLSVAERSMALLLSMFMIFSTLHASAMIKDRKSGTFDRYQFARQGGSGYVLGYILYNFLITYGQILLCMVALTLIQKDFAISIVEGLLLSIVIAAIATIFSMLICMGSKSELQANITASALAAVMSLLGGTFVAVEAMPGLLRVLSMASPIRWLVELVRVL